MLSGWLTWRFIKFIGVALFAAGVLTAIWGRESALRRKAVYNWSTWGLLVSWAAGYGLLVARGLTIAQHWVGASILTSLITLLAVSECTQRPQVPRWLAATGVAGLVSTLGVMTAREDPNALLALGVVAPCIAGSWAFRRAPKSADEGLDSAQGDAAALAWFYRLARAEGCSLLALLCIHMPLKYALKTEIDGGQGWFGWAHGVLQLTYLVALAHAARVRRWSLLTMVIGFVASLIPFGTFAFERHRKARDR